MKPLALLALVVPLFIICFPPPASALDVPERLVYELSWSGLKAGTAVHEVTNQEGELHLVFTARSTGWLKAILSIDDRTESVLFPHGGSTQPGVPRLFKENINEGRTHTAKEARFDPAGLQVETKDFLNKTTKSDAIGPRTFDSISLVYFIRSADLAPDRLISVQMYDCKRLWDAEVRVVGREKISTPRGRFNTIVVKALLKAEGATSRTGAMTVWLSDDNLRIPVRMKTKLKLGEFTATLTEGSYWP